MIKFYDETKSTAENKKQKDKMEHNASVFRLITSVVACVTATIVCGVTINSQIK